MRPLWEIARVFTRLGFTAFGGPAAHLSLMEDEIVRRRQWIDRTHFLDVVAAMNLVPGPTSTEVAINLGLIRGGWPGMLVSGVCFIAPAVLIILPIAWAYVTYGTLPQVQGIMAGINAAVVAIVANATLRFGKTALVDWFTIAIFSFSVGVYVFLRTRHVPEAELIVLGGAALVGIVRSGEPRAPSLAGLLLPFAVHMPDANLSSEFVRLAAFFLKVGATLFGSGYVLISYLQGGLVEQHRWLTERQLLDAVSVGQVTPGPLLTTATFIGYIRGHDITGTTPGALAGGVLATVAIFLPAFVFVGILGIILPKIRNNPAVRAALDAMNAAVVALMTVVTFQIGYAALGSVGWVLWAVAGGSLIALVAWRFNPTWLILIGAIAGWLVHR